MNHEKVEFQIYRYPLYLKIILASKDCVRHSNYVESATNEIYEDIYLGKKPNLSKKWTYALFHQFFTNLSRGCISFILFIIPRNVDPGWATKATNEPSKTECIF